MTDDDGDYYDAAYDDDGDNADDDEHAAVYI